MPAQQHFGGGYQATSTGHSQYSHPSRSAHPIGGHFHSSPGQLFPAFSGQAASQPAAPSAPLVSDETGPPSDSEGSDSTSDSSSDSSSGSRGNTPGSSKKKKKSKSKAKQKMQARIKAHLKKLTQVHGDFDHEVLDKKPLDMVSSMFNLSLQQDRDAVTYARKQKMTTMKEFRALISKNNSTIVAALRAACKQDDAKQLSRAVEACIKDLTSEYFEMPTHLIIISTLHFLTETTTPEFAGKRRTAQTLIREALIAPLSELHHMYACAQSDGRPL